MKTQLRKKNNENAEPDSPAEAVFVCRGVFLQQGGELQHGELLEQIHLQHGLAADLELG